VIEAVNLTASIWLEILAAGPSSLQTRISKQANRRGAAAPMPKREGGLAGGAPRLGPSTVGGCVLIGIGHTHPIFERWI
jgi:hypothetical protein